MNLELVQNNFFDVKNYVLSIIYVKKENSTDSQPLLPSKTWF